MGFEAHKSGMPSAPHVAVIGAGIGALSAAMLLSARGCRVTVLEAMQHVGGKARRVMLDGLAVDAGPTVFTLRSVLDQLFADAGADFSASVRLKPMPCLSSNFWQDGSRLDLHADVAQSADAIGAFAGANAAQGYRAFCKEAAAMFTTLNQPFMQSRRPSPLGLVRAAGISAMLQTRPFHTMWGALGRHFGDPRLRQLFGRFATYCGTSPFSAPATLMLIAHVEQEGVWAIEGGINAIAVAMADRIRAAGGHVLLGQKVERVEAKGGKASAVMCNSGLRLEADVVLHGGDSQAVIDGLFGEEAQPSVPLRGQNKRSLSAITLNAAAKLQGHPTGHHTVCFSRDYASEFKTLFGSRGLPDDPTVYICAMDRSGPTEKPPLGNQNERLLLLVNAPATGDENDNPLWETEPCHNRIVSAISRHGFHLEGQPEHQQVTTPREFAAMFPSTGGALYGRAIHAPMESFKRPDSRTRLPGFYLAGGSTHPGAGVPMVALSGRLAAEAILQDIASTTRFHPAATPGGISTG